MTQLRRFADLAEVGSKLALWKMMNLNHLLVDLENHWELNYEKKINYNYFINYYSLVLSTILHTDFLLQ